MLSEENFISEPYWCSP